MIDLCNICINLTTEKKKRKIIKYKSIKSKNCLDLDDLRKNKIIKIKIQDREQLFSIDNIEYSINYYGGYNLTLDFNNLEYTSPKDYTFEIIERSNDIYGSK